MGKKPLLTASESVTKISRVIIKDIRPYDWIQFRNKDINVIVQIIFNGHRVISRRKATNMDNYSSFKVKILSCRVNMHPYKLYAICKIRIQSTSQKRPIVRIIKERCGSVGNNCSNSFLPSPCSSKVKDWLFSQHLSLLISNIIRPWCSLPL